MSQPALFGAPVPVETPAKAAKRAKQIQVLRNVLREIVDGIDASICLLDRIDYFLARNGQLTVNDWDGLIRLGGYDVDIEDDEWEALESDPSAWTPVPEGWMGCRSGEMERNRFASSEIAMLVWNQHLIASGIDDARREADSARNELIRLIGIGPLPELQEEAA